mmetsp:Transcript_12643/g.40429  ORF Transcript_12643/g.40429 Transcript_12643/m.40429 type:complete len:236 (+) Transcript_12643:197-904(+)
MKLPMWASSVLRRSCSEATYLCSASFSSSKASFEFANAALAAEISAGESPTTSEAGKAFAAGPCWRGDKQSGAIVPGEAEEKGCEAAITLPGEFGHERPATLALRRTCASFRHRHLFTNLEHACCNWKSCKHHCATCRRPSTPLQCLWMWTALRATLCRRSPRTTRRHQRCRSRAARASRRKRERWHRACAKACSAASARSRTRQRARARRPLSSLWTTKAARSRRKRRHLQRAA